MTFDLSDPTPTWQEFLLSHTNLFKYESTEDLLYKSIDLAILLGPIYAKAMYLWWHGTPFLAERGALYLAGQESWALYRSMTKPFRILSNPVIMVPTITVVGAHAATSAYDEHVVAKAPEHERSGWWEFWSTMLTGTGPAASYTDI